MPIVGIAISSMTVEPRAQFRERVRKRQQSQRIALDALGALSPALHR
ncbi:hypothetical protein [Mesorhizobium sp.]|nr:hypothetical protein [Mesorhizobium sp.]